MNRDEFLRQLERLLITIPEGDRLDAIAYYTDYFDEAGLENEQDVIRELGSPEKVAQTILDDFKGAGSTQHSAKKDIPWVLIIIIAILTFPLWIGIVAGLFGGLIGIIAGIVGLLAGLLGSGIGIAFGGAVALVAGVIYLVTSPIEGLITIGIGAILLAIGLLLLLLFAWLAFKWIPTLVSAIVKAVKGIWHRNEGGNEI